MDTGDNRFAQMLELFSKNPRLLRGLASMFASGAGDAGSTSSASGDPPDLSGLVTRLGPLLGALSSSGGTDTPASASQDEEPAPNALMNAIDSVLGGSAATSAGGSEDAPSSDAERESPQGEGERAVPAGSFGGFGGFGGHGGKRPIRFPCDKRLTLLIALKPYLSPRRAAAVEQMVKFGKIGELLEGLLPANGGK